VESISIPPIAVTSQTKTQTHTVSGRWDFGVVGSHFIQGNCFLFVFPCIGTDLTMGRSLVQGPVENEKNS
jgi:hypothetical protein